VAQRSAERDRGVQISTPSFTIATSRTQVVKRSLTRVYQPAVLAASAMGGHRMVRGGLGASAATACMYGSSDAFDEVVHVSAKVLIEREIALRVEPLHA
jgi:hypothetical protein